MEAMTKEKRTHWTPLDRRVIAVAVEGAVGDWAAYIGAVEGNNYETEWQEVARNGSKLPKDVAEVLFPDFKDLAWRY
jgi:hypothetical protein